MFKENRFFFIGFGILLIACLGLLFQIETGDAVIFFQERRTDFWTRFFSYVTQLGEEIPYILAFFILFYFRNLREAIFIGLTGVVVTIVSFLLKSYFRHPRPRLFFEQKGVFSALDFPEWLHINTGHTAFPSGHTISAFALYAIIAFFITRKKIFAIFMLLFASSVGFSRIYLFQHFLKDVAFGAIIGVIIACFLYVISEKTLKN